MIAPLILIIILVFIASLFIIATIVEETVRLKYKRETKQQVYGIINELVYDIRDLSIASKHMDKSIDPIKVLDLIKEKIDKIDKI